MSKRNRSKFRDKDRAIERDSSVIVSNSSPASVQASGGAASQHAAEYRIIRADMIRLVALNFIILAAVLVVFYTNRSSGYLERLFEQLF